MSLLARAYVEQADYETIRNWWLSRNLTDYVVPKESLPPTGVTVVGDGQMICCGWVHLDRYSALAQIGNIMTSPTVKGKIKVKAVELCFDRLILMAEKEGAVQLLARFSENGLLSLLKRRGFRQHPIPMYEMERRLPA